MAFWTGAFVFLDDWNMLSLHAKPDHIGENCPVLDLHSYAWHNTVTAQAGANTS